MVYKIFEILKKCFNSFNISIIKVFNKINSNFYEKSNIRPNFYYKKY